MPCRLHDTCELIECKGNTKKKNTKRYRFSKRCRLTKTDEFSSVFNFRKRLSGHFLAIHYRIENKLQNFNEPVHAGAYVGTARLGVIVAKKIMRRSVDRNYARRVIREWFRLSLQEIPRVDIVVRVQRKFGKIDRRALQQECQELLDKLKRKCE